MIYKWIIRKKKPAHKLGRSWKFLASEVDALARADRAARDVVTAAHPVGSRAKEHPAVTPKPMLTTSAAAP